MKKTKGVESANMKKLLEICNRDGIFKGVSDYEIENKELTKKKEEASENYEESLNFIVASSDEKELLQRSLKEEGRKNGILRRNLQDIEEKERTINESCIDLKKENKNAKRDIKDVKEENEFLRKKAKILEEKNRGQRRKFDRQLEKFSSKERGLQEKNEKLMDVLDQKNVANVPQKNHQRKEAEKFLKKALLSFGARFQREATLLSNKHENELESVKDQARTVIKKNHRKHRKEYKQLESSLNIVPTIFRFLPRPEKNLFSLGSYLALTTVGVILYSLYQNISRCFVVSGSLEDDDEFGFEVEDNEDYSIDVYKIAFYLFIALTISICTLCLNYNHNAERAKENINHKKYKNLDNENDDEDESDESDEGIELAL